MKKLMTPAEKAQYFALYLGQKVHVEPFLNEKVEVGFLKPGKHDYLSLRSIEQITPKELNELSEIVAIRKYKSHIETISHIDQEYLYLYRLTSEFLRSIGIATPFKQYSIQDLIDNGVLKFES